MNDDRLATSHHHFFSHHAASKILAERRIRQADGAPSIGDGRKRLRTGCVRPGNGIFGSCGNIICEAYLARRQNPWFPTSSRTLSDSSLNEV
jgi:hypothetical protein